MVYNRIFLYLTFIRRIYVFNNFEVSPLGNAQLSTNQQGNLLVSNIGQSGLDGVMIDVHNRDNYQINFNELPEILNDGILRITSVGKNIDNQTSTIGEKVVWFEPSTNQVQFGYNMSLMPNKFTIFGELNGVRVFEIDKDNPYTPSGSPAPQGIGVIIGVIAAVVTAAATVYIALKTSHRKEIYRTFWPNGEIKTEKIIEITDPQPFEIFVDGQPYLVTNFGIEYQYDFPENNDIKTYDNTAVLISGYNLNLFEITSIS